MTELRAVMMRNWENQFVNVKLVGRVMVVHVKKRQSVVAMNSVEITGFVSTELVHASKDSKEMCRTCKRVFSLERGSGVVSSTW